MIKSLIFAAALLGALPTTASPAPTSGAETAIPFISRNGIIDWKADGRRGLYIRSMSGRWYYARTQGLCGRLKTAITLGFETSAADQLDRFGAIYAEGWRCQIASLVESGAPPKRS